ncbi:MAG TPA: hypothetical protein VFR89_03235, partial [candidate division Zixibacteria bacterium]|nr:hypothetical protein [candidate division Zixibacteria bacterium]
MKTLLVFAFLLALAAPVFAQPDVRDSVILESKTIYPGTGHPYMTVKIFITNKDTLARLTVSILSTSTSGGAYATVTNPRSFFSVVTPLVNTLKFDWASGFFSYHSDSPDTFLLSAGRDPADPATHEPPNSVRKAVWEIEFDTVLSNLGTIELDSATYFGVPTTFTTIEPVTDLPVNFLKGVLTVPSYKKGDLNQDRVLSPADVVLMLNCIALGQPPPAGEITCDLNCDGAPRPADLVLLLNAVFLGSAF